MKYKNTGSFVECGHSRQQYVVSIIVLFFLIVVSVGVILQAAPITSQGEVLVSLSFQQPISDEVLIAILASSEARPRRIFTVASGLYGSYRPPEGLDLLDSLAQKRAQIITNQREGRKLLSLTAQQFISSLETGELDRNSDLQNRAAGIIRQYRLTYSIEEAAQSGVPLVYAAEILVPPAHVDSLKRDSRVVEITQGIPVTTKEGVRWEVPAPKSPIVPVSYDTVSPVSSTELLDELARISDASSREHENEGH